jgi:excinuclease ABC subunit C
MISSQIVNVLESLPGKPGVYQFVNAQGDIIYVGKAKDLKKRVSSYFSRTKYDNAKLRVLVSKVVDIKHIIVNSESDALLLENNLIKKLKPRYNILLKDDKTYPWICIKNEPFPRIFTTRNVVHDGSRYFGPYTSGYIVKTVMELIRAIYPIRTCNLSLTKFNIQQGKFKACLEYQLGNCLAPCVGNQELEEYNENINAIVDILKGNLQTVKKILADNMKKCANEFKFEEAHIYKEKLAALERFQAKSTIVSQSYSNLDVFSIANEKSFACVNYLKIIKGAVIQSHNLELKKNLDEPEEELLAFAIAEIRQRVGSVSREIIVPMEPEFKLVNCSYTVPVRGDKLKLLQLSHRNAKAHVMERIRNLEKKEPQVKIDRILQTLQKDFRTKELPKHIECFDNSNLQGTNAVAACVVFRNGKPSKKEYRHFNIKTVEGPDDFASMQEVVFRRYKRMLENNETLPQLVVIDGGKGQLSSALSAFKELSIEQEIQLIGIAKRLEEIYFPGDPNPLYLDKNSESLRVIQHARNEAHRFGISHHRLKRSNNLLKSELTEISGIGPKTMQALLKEFKNVVSIKEAKLDELIKVIGVSKGEIVYKHFNKD